MFRKLIRTLYGERKLVRRSHCGHSEIIQPFESVVQSNSMLVQPQVPVVVVCPNCRNPVPPDANFCPMCGLNLKPQ